MKIVHMNPLTNTVNAVTHTQTETTFHVFPDGTFQMDMILNGEVLIYTFGPSTTPDQIAALHATLFATTEAERAG